MPVARPLGVTATTGIATVGPASPVARPTRTAVRNFAPPFTNAGAVPATGLLAKTTQKPRPTRTLPVRSLTPPFTNSGAVPALGLLAKLAPRQKPPTRSLAGTSIFGEIGFADRALFEELFTNPGAVPALGLLAKGTQKARPTRVKTSVVSTYFQMPGLVPGLPGGGPAQEYAVTALGGRRIIHEGVLLHAGRLVWMDSTSPVTLQLFAMGYIKGKTTETVHDWTTQTPIGQEAAEALTTYTVQAAGSGKVNYNGTVLTTGQTLQLDAADANAIQLIAMGYIA